MTNTNMLRNLINKKGMKMKFVASHLGLSAYGLKLKIDNKSEFKTSEVSALCDLLNIENLQEREKIFFER